MSNIFTISEYKTQLDIASRVADHLGQSAPLTLQDPGKLVEIFNRIYNKIRQTELRRNVWRFAIKRAALRARDTTTRTFVPSAWTATTGTPNPLGYYIPGTIVSSNGRYYICDEKVPNTDTPGTDGSAWKLYFGSLDVSAWDHTITYFPGELVYVAAGDGTYKVFMALSTINGGSSADPRVPDAWDAPVSYNFLDIVTYSSVTYISLVDINLNQQPSTHPTQWFDLTAFPQFAVNSGWNILFGSTVERHTGIYPIGSGPASQTFTRNVYRLPFGFLRKAPEDPKAGLVSILGAPSGIMFRDYDLEDDFIVTRETDCILYRFVGDVNDISKFDPMFAEALACRLAIELCEPVTQSTERLKNLQGFYGTKMREARIENAIEVGPEAPPEDDYITTRL